MKKGKHLLSGLAFHSGYALRLYLADSQDINIFELLNRKFDMPPIIESLWVKGVLIDSGGCLRYFDFSSPLVFQPVMKGNERLVTCAMDCGARHMSYDVAADDVNYVKVSGELTANLETGVLNISSASYTAYNAKQELISINECQLIIDGEVTLL